MSQQQYLDFLRDLHANNSLDVHVDPNLDGWPDPNNGWPDVNTTRIAKNNMKVTSTGDVCVLAVGRRTITTANAYQKMVKPGNGGLSSWNSFVRVYDAQFHVPKYSSLVVGVWDTLTQAGGSNTDLYGVYKTSLGVVCVGRQTADSAGLANGNDIPITNVTPWGNATPQNESAILVYYQAANLANSEDSILTGLIENPVHSEFNDLTVYPNPAYDKIFVSFTDQKLNKSIWKYMLTDHLGKEVQSGELLNRNIDLKQLQNGIFHLQLYNQSEIYDKNIIIVR